MSTTLTANIIERLISAETDQRLQLAGGYWVRKMKAADDWDSLRLGIRYSSCATANMSDGLKFYLGLCYGTATPPGSASPEHFMGIQSNGTFGWNSSNHYISVGSQFLSVQDGSATTAALSTSGTGGAFLIGNVDYLRSAVYIDFIKGSPWTIKVARSTSITPGDFDLDTFESGMYSAGQGHGLLTTSTAFTPDESTYGVLDSVCFSWLGEGESNAFEISDIAVRRLA